MSTIFVFFPKKTRKFHLSISLLDPCDPMLYAHAPVLMQAHAEDAERWEKQSVNPEISMEKLKQLR